MKIGDKVTIAITIQGRTDNNDFLGWPSSDELIKEANGVS